MVISKDEREEWYTNPVTVEFRRMLKQLVENIKGDWSRQRFVGDTSDMTAQKNAMALGRILSLEDILELTEGDEDEQSTGEI